jgi:DNA repair protein RadD
MTPTDLATDLALEPPTSDAPHDGQPAPTPASTHNGQPAQSTAWPGLAVVPISTPTAMLRPLQVRAINETFASLKAGHTRTVLQAPTGFGKSLAAAAIVEMGRRHSRRICFTAPAISLIDQTVERFEAYGLNPDDIGVIQADHPRRRPWAAIQVASVQTLARRTLPETDLVIVDEAHIQHRTIGQWMGQCPRLPFIGLSATPWARGMGKLYSSLVRPTSLAELIGEGLLTPFRVFAPSHPDLSQVRTVAGDYHEGDLAECMSAGALVADVIATWLARGEGRPTLCFAVNRAHAQTLHEQFAAAGVRTAYVDALTPREERDEIGRRMASGDVQVAVNIGTLTTGVDWDIRCIILARPTKSAMLYCQIFGRGLRTALGKDSLIFLDHSDTVLRLGFPTDVDAAHDSLDDGKPKSKSERKVDDRERLPKDCPACAYLMPAGTKSCPACGETMPRPQVDQVDGELTELAMDGRSIRRKGGKGEPSVRERLVAMGKAEIIGQLYTLRDERGRKDGWVAHTYRSIFDVWPKGLDRCPPRQPHPLLRSFAKSRDIAWAHGYRSKSGGGHAVA